MICCTESNVLRLFFRLVFFDLKCIHLISIHPCRVCYSPVIDIRIHMFLENVRHAIRCFLVSLGADADILARIPNCFKICFTVFVDTRLFRLAVTCLLLSSLTKASLPVPDFVDWFLLQPFCAQYWSTVHGLCSSIVAFHLLSLMRAMCLA